MRREFRVGDRYHDTGSYRRSEDQFLRWIRGPLDSGIKNTGRIRDLTADRSDMPAALVLVSNDSGISQHDDPWEDTLAINTGHISYWGDAKASNPYDESVQNRKIKSAFESAAAGHREEVPPILVFCKPESGVVEFCGLCVPDHLEVRSYYTASETQVPNYQFHLSILNTSVVPVTWFHERAQQNDDSGAPDVWQGWIRTGTVAQWPTGESLDQSGRLRPYEASEISVSDAFRTEVFDRYGNECTLTGIQEDELRL